MVVTLLPAILIPLTVMWLAFIPADIMMPGSLSWTQQVTSNGRRPLEAVQTMKQKLWYKLQMVVISWRAKQNPRMGILLPIMEASMAGWLSWMLPEMFNGKRLWA